MKRKITVLLLVISLLSSLAACGNTGSTGGNNNSGKVKYTSDYDKTKYNEPGKFPIFKEKQTITVTLPSSTSVEDFNTNYQTTLMEKELNADLQITAVPSKEYKTKIGLMMASDDKELGDAIMGAFSDGEIASYAENDSILELTNYYYNTSIAYYLNQAKERVGIDFFPQVTMTDGKIYGIAKYNDSVSNVNPDKMFVFTPWLDKLGIDRKDVKTIEDFKNLLIKLRDEDLNGNGKKDEIANVQYDKNNSWFNYLMNPFVYAGDENYMIVTNDELSLAYQQDEWKDGLKYMKDLYDEGLISPLTFTQDSAAFKSMANSEETIIGTFCSLGTGTVGDERRNQYVAIAPLEGPNGSLASYEPTSADSRMMINKNAANPEAVFRFGDLMVSEEISICTVYGEKGVDYLEADPDKDVSSFAELGYKASIIPILTFTGLQNKTWYQTGPYIRQKAITAGIVDNADNNSYKAAPSQIMYEGHNPKEYITKLIFTNEERDDIESKMAALLEYVNEMNYNFISGKKDIDADWDEFQDQLSLIGADDVLAAAQEAYDRMSEFYK